MTGQAEAKRWKERESGGSRTQKMRALMRIKPNEETNMKYPTQPPLPMLRISLNFILSSQYLFPILVLNWSSIWRNVLISWLQKRAFMHHTHTDERDTKESYSSSIVLFPKGSINIKFRSHSLFNTLNSKRHWSLLSIFLATSPHLLKQTFHY